MCMNRKIYRKIAKRHGVSVKEVKHDIQEAIDKTYGEGEKPAIDEFIDRIAQRAKEEYDKNPT